ncbi:hypothetical protein Lalb_Chr24g0396691 [Lupinus albus]|uniref:Uncharacterized protein n=1 Tax=Lupinus albus TaxID=3870 RepID=A0A6A4NEQ1_LUPAL|nr:hypothetical protein Lalb_Chr24g0396691 [Lupinus albus]
MNGAFLDTLRKSCSPRKKGQPDPLVYLNLGSGSSYKFTETYYKRIHLLHQAVLGIAQQLFYGDDTEQITEEFAAGFEGFPRVFFISAQLGECQSCNGKQWRGTPKLSTYKYGQAKLVVCEME